MKINFKSKKILSLFIIIVIIALFLIMYFRIIKVHRNNNLFAMESERYAEEIENPVFKLEKALVYSDANIQDLSENKNLSDINISQFTDFALYINNKVKSKELTEENTINKIYIDNIVVSDTTLGEQKVYFKDVKDLCKYVPIKQETNKIEYTVIHSNSDKKQNKEANVFYTDCSEPIILSYVNENIIEHKDVSNSKEKLALNGSMLKYLGINLDVLNYKITFTINIENNLGELYQCKYSMNVDLNSSEGGMFTGYIMQIHDMTEQNYKFKKVNT